MALGDWKKRLMGEANRLVNQFGPPIAIDFGTASLKVLQIANADTPSLIAAACVPTPEELLNDPSKRMVFQLEALPKIFKSVGFKGRRAVCAVPASQAFCKHMQFQADAGASIGALVRSAVPAQLGCDASALVFRHIEVGQLGRGGKTEVICMAAARELVDRFMRTMKDAKLEPVGMHIEYTAAIRAFDSITRRDEDAGLTTLYVDIGGGCTKVTIGHGQNLVFARMIDLGGRHLDQIVARQLHMELAEARAHRLQLTELSPKRVKAAAAAETNPAENGGLDPRLACALPGTAAEPEADPAVTALMDDRRRGGEPAGLTPDVTRGPAAPFEPARADLTEPLEIMTDEISMCLRYHESSFPDRRIDRAIFIGGEARHVGLCQHIARTLRLPAQIADPMAGIARNGKEPTLGVDFRTSQPGWAMTLGLCLCPTDL